jgi:hypothetical protein
VGLGDTLSASSGALIGFAVAQGLAGHVVAGNLWVEVCPAISPGAGRSAGRPKGTAEAYHVEGAVRAGIAGTRQLGVAESRTRGSSVKHWAALSWGTHAALLVQYR